jgi:hypothetical protein
MQAGRPINNRALSGSLTACTGGHGNLHRIIKPRPVVAYRISSRDGRLAARRSGTSRGAASRAHRSRELHQMPCRASASSSASSAPAAARGAAARRERTRRGVDAIQPSSTPRLDRDPLQRADAPYTAATKHTARHPAAGARASRVLRLAPPQPVHSREALRAMGLRLSTSKLQLLRAEEQAALLFRRVRCWCCPLCPHLTSPAPPGRAQRPASRNVTRRSALTRPATARRQARCGTWSTTRAWRAAAPACLSCLPGCSGLAGCRGRVALFSCAGRPSCHRRSSVTAPTRPVPPLQVVALWHDGQHDGRWAAARACHAREPPGPTAAPGCPCLCRPGPNAPACLPAAALRPRPPPPPQRPPRG